MLQLAIDYAPRSSGPFFHEGPVDRSGAFAYTHLIRAEDAPDETTVRGAKARESGARKAGWAKRLGTAEEWCARIVEHLATGRPRTFNRIAVELCGSTADTVFDEAPDHGLWLAVERGLLLLTFEAPILFVRRDRAVRQ
jgi:hypothetical protein